MANAPRAQYLVRKIAQHFYFVRVWLHDDHMNDWSNFPPSAVGVKSLTLVVVLRVKCPIPGEEGVSNGYTREGDIEATN